MENVINSIYIISSILFISGVKKLGTTATAAKGNLLSAIGMFLAVLATLINDNILHSWHFITLAILLGTVIGVVMAKRVQMTAMPELVGLFNGLGGLASLLIGWAEFVRLQEIAATHTGVFFKIVLLLTIIVGAITFTGSLVAYLKLSERLKESSELFLDPVKLNLILCVLIVASSLSFFASAMTIANTSLMVVSILSLLIGYTGVKPIGGGDMPVVVSLLNSFSGLAASAAGFVLLNNVLIVAGCLVGASGLILTIIMCKSMNRSLKNVLLSGFGSQASSQQEIEGEMHAISVKDAYYVIESAKNVVVVPGYGMAVAQAQHVVKELCDILEERGAEIRFVIHPVAGRMPGHMNVLLAEADVPYEQLVEMDNANRTMENVDLAIVIGANDVVNPAALSDEGCSIYGMPIINVHQARNVFVLKRGEGKGFSGLINKLFYTSNTRMIYGDAKATISQIISEFAS